MKTFDTKTCPLCQKKLYVKRLDYNIISYRCLEMIYQVEEIIVDAWASTHKDRVEKLRYEAPHYDVIISNLSGEKASQVTTLPPYQMVSKEGSGRTTINKWPFLRGMTTDFIMEIPTLLPDHSPDKMLERVKLLILFS